MALRNLEEYRREFVKGTPVPHRELAVELANSLTGLRHSGKCAEIGFEYWKPSTRCECGLQRHYDTAFRVFRELTKPRPPQDGAA